MRNFYNQPTNKIFDKMFGKGPRQIQADPTQDLTGCNCCNCGDVAGCKGCIQGHIMDAKAGCCFSKNEGLIFEYERPEWSASGIECCNQSNQKCGSCDPLPGEGPAPPCGDARYVTQPCGSGCCDTSEPRKRCCGQRKLKASNVKFLYNYAGQYFKIHYGPATAKNSGPKEGATPNICGYCDYSSHLDGPDVCSNDRYDKDDSCLDFNPPYTQEGDLKCVSCWDIPWKNCKCLGSGQRADKRTFGDPRGKRLSRFRKRQMEIEPYYRWLLDIMCYDEGNKQYSPARGFFAEIGDPIATVIPDLTAGTLYDHLIGVVHCEHWYEQAQCSSLNPLHDDEDGILGGWLVNPLDGTRGVNTSKLAPRFWIYACSGVPLFDFEIDDAEEKGIITGTDKENLYLAFGLKLTPPQGIMQKLAAGGYFDTGDWRQEASSEIRQLRGNTFTAPFYGGILNGNPNFGSCCLGITCIGGVSAEYCEATGGNFFPATTCSESFCKTQACSTMKYLGPVRKRWYKKSSNISPLPPNFPTPLIEPNISNPKKARPNRISGSDTIYGYDEYRSGRVLEQLQLPEDLIQNPWEGKEFPREPEPGEEPSEEYKAFELWRDAQWVYMHARPGGWSYVCPGYGYGAEGEELDLLQIVKIPDLPRGVGHGQLLGCLDGCDGRPQKNSPATDCSSFPENYCMRRKLSCTDEGGCQVTDEYEPSPEISCSYSYMCISANCDPDPARTGNCISYPEKGGRVAGCGGLNIAPGCDGIRFLFYVVGAMPDFEANGLACIRTLNSFLYRVNVENGNFENFCPHKCRQLQVPREIADRLPAIHFNRPANKWMCYGNQGRLCPGTFCYSQPLTLPSLSVGPEPSCCRKTYGPDPYTQRTQEPSAQHPARNREACPFYPGPGYPTIYDGQFLGIPVFGNPVGCCWKCKLVGGPGGYRPLGDVYLGRKTYFECDQEQPDAIHEFDNFQNQGRGFIYYDGINSISECTAGWAGDCACGYYNPPTFLPPASSGQYCEQQIQGGSGPPGGGPGPGGGVG